MSDVCLQAENLHLWRGDRHVLRGVGLTARAGEVLQVVGANGAGKTTLLRTLCGMIQPEEGRITWAGRDVREDLHAFHAQLAYLGHEAPLKTELTARENLRYWIGMRRRVSPAEIDRALEQTGAGAVRERLVRAMSAGQKRRVALAGLLLLSVPRWLRGGPTTNLDTEGQALVGRMIEEQVRAGGIVVAAVHHALMVAPERLKRLELSSP